MKPYGTLGQQIEPSITLAITAKANAMKKAGEDVISFSAGEPDFRTPEMIRKAAIEAIEKKPIGYTPAHGMPELREAIARKLERENQLSYSAEEIVVSNGAKHSLYNIFQALLDPADEVLIPVPYWVSYPEHVRLAGGNPVLVPTTEENGFCYTLEALEAAVTDKTKALLLNSPSNPTGGVYDLKTLETIADFAIRHDLFVISDEIYERLIYDGKHHSIAALPGMRERTIVVNGFSKGYAMTGWRLGYTASNRTLADLMKNIQSHATSNPSTISQYAGIAALEGDQSVVDEMVVAYKKRRDYMIDRIATSDVLSCFEPAGAFYLYVNIEKTFGKTYGGKVITGSLDFADYLLESQKVAVIPGIGFGTDAYIRLSYATSLENIKEGLDRILAAVE